MRLLAGLKKKGKLMQSCEFANDDDLHSRAARTLPKAQNVPKHTQTYKYAKTYKRTTNKEANTHTKQGLSPSSESRAPNLYFTSKPKWDCQI